MTNIMGIWEVLVAPVLKGNKSIKNTEFLDSKFLSIISDVYRFDTDLPRNFYSGLQIHLETVIEFISETG
jgi:hypothetical protein